MTDPPFSVRGGLDSVSEKDSRPFAFHSFSFALNFFPHPRPSAGAQRICGHLREKISNHEWRE